MTQSFSKELEQFDKNRVVAAWEGLITRQQSTLEAAGVPTMFVTSSQTDREVKSQRFICCRILTITVE